MRLFVFCGALYEKEKNNSDFTKKGKVLLITFVVKARKL
jgi:hypothetical protein